MVKFDRDGEGCMEAVGMRNCSLDIWDGSELELARSKKSNSYFEKNMPIGGVLNTSIFTVRDASHWLDF